MGTKTVKVSKLYKSHVKKGKTATLIQRVNQQVIATTPINYRLSESKLSRSMGQ